MSSKLFGGSTSQGKSTSTPLNLQNPAYTALSGPLANYLTSFLGNNANTGAPLNPFQVGGVSSRDTTNNPLVAPMTGQQGNLLDMLPGFAGASGTLPLASGVNANMLSPNYAASLATSPQTQGAISAAVNPMISAFNQNISPSLVSQATAAGQRVNTAGGGVTGGGVNPNGINQVTTEGQGARGSSAFEQAQNTAQNNLQQNIGSVAGTISQNAYQTGLAQQANAVSQAQALSTTELSNTINALSASALPQLIQQYGINQGLQLFQGGTQAILTALGLGISGSQPAIGNVAQSNFSSQASPGLISGVGNALSGVGNIGSFLTNANPFNIFG